MTALKTNQKITPFLWFDNNAEEALEFYTSIFENSDIKDIIRYGKNEPMPEGTFMTAVFVLEGQEFMALNAGPKFQFTEAISFFVKCKSQEEVDYYWEKLSAGGEIQSCGWLKDKYGLSWQIIPDILGELMSKDKTGNVMQSILGMDKIIVEELQKAYDSGLSQVNRE